MFLGHKKQRLIHWRSLKLWNSVTQRVKRWAPLWGNASATPPRTGMQTGRPPALLVTGTGARLPLLRWTSKTRDCVENNTAHTLDDRQCGVVTSERARKYPNYASFPGKRNSNRTWGAKAARMCRTGSPRKDSCGGRERQWRARGPGAFRECRSLYSGEWGDFLGPGDKPPHR